MRKKIITTLLPAFFAIAANVCAASPGFLTTIPTQCDQVEEKLSKVQVPKGFKVTVNEAHKRAMTASDVIKPCASKLEQAVYYDNQYYYFTNSVLFSSGASFPDKFVKIDGITGEADNHF